MGTSIWELLYGSFHLGASIWELLYASLYNALPVRYQCVTNALLSALPQCVTSLFISFAIETFNRVALEKVNLEILLLHDAIERFYCKTNEKGGNAVG